MIPDWLPNMHPMVVHFPIAIYSLAVLMDVSTYFLPRSWWDETKNLILYGFAAVSVVVVYFTGQAAADTVFLEAQAQRVLTTHAGLAGYTAGFLVLYFLIRTGIFIWKKAASNFIQITLTLLSFAGLFLIYETAERGAEMIFAHAVGVQQQENETTEPAAEQESESLFFNTEQGWSWEIGEDPLAELSENFHWLTGSAEDNNLQPEQISGENSGLSFNGDNLNGFFTSHEKYQSIQADYFLDLSAFRGEVILANHVQNQAGYDFVSVNSDGTVTQGRVSDGETEIFEEGSSDISAPVFVRVVSDDTHFRGYIDKTMVVHGHSSAPDDGSVGLAFEGSGKLVIDKIELTDL